MHSSLWMAAAVPDYDPSNSNDNLGQDLEPLALMLIKAATRVLEMEGRLGSVRLHWFNPLNR